MRCLLFLLLSFIAQNAFSQEIRYFSRNFQTHEKIKTTLERHYFLEENGTRTEDYDKGKLTRKSHITGTQSLDEVDAYIWFAHNWRAEIARDKKPYFSLLTATFNTYNAKGNLEDELYAYGYNIRFGQIWSAANTPLLVNGSGSNINWTLDKEEQNHAIYKDSVLVSSYALRVQQQDTIYFIADKMATPVGGLEAFMSHLARNIQYPGLAALLGKEGIVYVRFTVDEKGALGEFVPINRPGFNFDKNAIKKMAHYPAWEPAQVQGKPVKTRFTIPFRFQMEN